MEESVPERHTETQSYSSARVLLPHGEPCLRIRLNKQCLPVSPNPPTIPGGTRGVRYTVTALLMLTTTVRLNLWHSEGRSPGENNMDIIC